MIKQSPKVEYEITKNPYLTQQVGRVQIGKSSLKT